MMRWTRLTGNWLHEWHGNSRGIGEGSQLVIGIKGDLYWRRGTVLTIRALEIAR